MSDVSMRTARRAYSLLALVGFLASTFLVAGISATFTVSQIPRWYATLAKPGFNPPNEIFGPVWTLLYTLMAVAAWLVWRRPDSVMRKMGLLWFGIQLALNFTWSLIFFRYHHLAFALLDIVLLGLAIVATMVFFFRVRKAAGWMFVPYLAWVGFASLLNFAIWLKN